MGAPPVHRSVEEEVRRGGCARLTASSECEAPLKSELVEWTITVLSAPICEADR